MTEKTRTRLMIAGGLFAFFTVDGLLMFGYKYFDVLARSDDVPPLVPLIEEMTGSYAAAITVGALLWVTHGFRLNSQNWRRRIPSYMLGMFVYSAFHTSMNALGRQLLFPIAGLGSYDYGTMVLRFPMEFFNDSMNFWMWIALFHLFYYYRESRDRELKTARLESELTRAQLANLRAQLQPHFLFNTLNAISSHMYQDPHAADRMIAQLSDLLRATLSSSTKQKVTLRDELGVLGLYFEMMKARFEDRLDLRIDVDGECAQAMVPSMILQPLVENAIQHGTATLTDVGKIDVSIRAANEVLELSVRDNGPGIDEGLTAVRKRGLGINNTAERLERLYGKAHSFELTNGSEGGFTVSVKIPFELSDVEDEAADAPVAAVADTGESTRG